MMQHDGFLIVIFFVLALVVPGLIFMRVYGTAVAGVNSTKSSDKKKQDQEPSDTE